MGLGHRVTADLSPPILYHAVGQGALAVEIRTNDSAVRELCERLNHQETQWMCVAERACLRVLEGGCSVPVGVESSMLEGGHILKLSGCVTAVDGKSHVEHTLSGTVRSVEDAEAIGEELAKVLIETGAKTILDDIAKDRRGREE
jgi:hydroxymethylbilane synthase